MTSFKRITMICTILFFSVMLCNLFAWGDDDTVSVIPGNYHSETSALHNSNWCVAANNDTCYAVWSFMASPREVWFAVSYDSMETWEDSVKLSSNYSYWPSIASMGDTVHVIWKSVEAGCQKIKYRRSENKGATWETGVNIADDSVSNKYYPNIRANGSYVYVAWRDSRGSPSGYKIYFDYSSDNGDNWHTDTIIGNISTGHGCDFPSVSVYGNNVDVAWQYYDGSDYEVKHRRSANGTSWGSVHNVTNCDSINEMHPSIATSSNFVLVTYAESDTISYSRIKAARSSNGGSNWSIHTVDTTTGDYIQDFPSVSYVDCNAHVVWEDHRRNNNKDVRYAVSYNSGWSWLSSVMISDTNSIDSRKPTIHAMSDDDNNLFRNKKNLHVTWTELYYSDIRADYHEVLGDFHQYDYIVQYDPESQGGGEQTLDIDTKSFTSSKVLICPNPMKSRTSIEYFLPKPKHLRIAVFDVSGRRIKSLFDGLQERGTHYALWDGRDDKGNNLEAGVYFIKVIGIGGAKVIKMQ